MEKEIEYIQIPGTLFEKESALDRVSEFNKTANGILAISIGIDKLLLSHT
jgi:hypothetical protein